MALTKEQLKANIDAMEKQGASPTEVQGWLDSLKTSTPQTSAPSAPPVSAPPGVGQKVLSGLGKVGEEMSQFVAGSTGKAVGGLITAGIGGATTLAGQIAKRPELVARGAEITKRGEAGITPMNIAGTALELYPGGGAISDSLKALPGGKAVASGIEKLLDHIPASLREQAIKQYSQALKPTTKEAKAITEKVVPGLIEKGITMKSPAQLAERAGEELLIAGKDIGTFFEKLPSSVKTNVKPILDSLSKFKEQYKVAGQEIRPEAIRAIEGVEQKVMSVAQSGDKASMKNIRELRQIFDEHFDVSKGIDDITTYTKKAERAAANAIRSELAKDSPTLAKLNENFNFWQGVKDVASSTAIRQTGQEASGYFSKLAGGLGGVMIGAATGLGPVADIVGGILGEVGVSILKSPGWKTVSAVVKDKLANAIAKGDAKTAALLVSKAAKGVINVAIPPGTETR